MPPGIFLAGTATRNIMAAQHLYQDKSGTTFRLYGVALTGGFVSVGIGVHRST